MIRFYPFRRELAVPQPAKDVYVKRPTGRGWPEECPPIRAANAAGFDLFANFDVAFTRQGDGDWQVESNTELSSDFDWTPDDDAPGRPLTQRYAWPWERGQTLPHVISDDVYEVVRHQMKVSTFLFLAADANETVLFCDPPNAPPMHERGWRAMSALAEIDWYPASYPWHVVLELDPRRERVEIKQGEVLCRLLPMRRDTYFARPMSDGEFGDFFDRGQRWLATHGKAHNADGCPATSLGGDALDITRTYVRQQVRSRYVVLD